MYRILEAEHQISLTNNNQCHRDAKKNQFFFKFKQTYHVLFTKQVEKSQKFAQNTYKSWHMKFTETVENRTTKKPTSMLEMKSSEQVSKIQSFRGELKYMTKLQPTLSQKIETTIL